MYIDELKFQAVASARRSIQSLTLDGNRKKFNVDLKNLNPHIPPLRSSYEETWTWRGSVNSRAMQMLQMQTPRHIGSAAKRSWRKSRPPRPVLFLVGI